MMVHIFTQVSVYSTEFIHMLTGYFNPADHVIVFRKKPVSTIGLNNLNIKILYLCSRKELIDQMPALLKAAERIIFHSFPVSRSLIFWFHYRKFMNKAVWIFWGQDIYWYRYSRKTPSNWVYEKIRMHLIKKLGAIFGPTKEDYNYIVAHYHSKAIFIRGMYPFPTDFNLLKSLRGRTRRDGIACIQLGNSANPSNNLEEVLLFFGRQKSKKFRIYCPLSYGDPEYAKSIIELGVKVLGDQFIPVTNFMDRSHYAEFIASMDILVMNHTRQQGLGNIFSYLYLGKKVYIRHDNSSYPFFKENGLSVFDTSELIASENIDALVKMDENVALNNISTTESMLSAEAIVSGWKQILNSKSSAII